MNKLSLILFLTFFITQQSVGQGGKTCDGCVNSFFSSVVLLYVNVPVNTVNIIQLVKGGSHSKFIPIAGLIGGAIQIALGIHGYPRWQVDPNYFDRSRSDFNSQAAYSIFNIGFGAATMGLSTWNLLKNKRRKEKQTSWNIRLAPINEKQIAYAITFGRKF